jgi:transposase-like protein
MTKKTDQGRIPDELIDQLLIGYEKRETRGPDRETGILKQLTARLIERALEAEMTEHLGYEKHAAEGYNALNSRSTRRKTLKTDQGPVEIDVPRGREGTFEPKLVKKRQTRFTGFDEKIRALYARGMTVRDIQGHLEELYGVEVSPDLISRATHVSYKDRKAVVADLKPIYTAASHNDAEASLAEFEAKWGRRYEMISSSWRANWERVVPFLDFPPDVRRVIYTTNQIEALNSSLRKLLQHRGHFPSDEAVTKILFLALRRFEKKWSRTLWNWSAALGQFAVFFPGGIPAL